MSFVGTVANINKLSIDLYMIEQIKHCAKSLCERKRKDMEFHTKGDAPWRLGGITPVIKYEYTVRGDHL